MKKINSNHYGHKVLGSAALFLFVLPPCCRLLFSLFPVHFLKIIMSVSFGTGLLIAVLFTILLIVELHQDKVMNRKYAALKNTKLAVGNGLYECQSCGNRQVQKTDKECEVCGTKFHF